jgi:hypothetical protein
MIANKTYLIFLIITHLFLNGCGYTPIYSSNNIAFKISNIQYENNRINNKISKSLKSISNSNSNNEINLIISTRKQKRTLSKNKNGNAENFELKIILKVNYLNNEKVFNIAQSYNNLDNKFELNQYEKLLENQLIEKAVDEVISYLINTQ